MKDTYGNPIDVTGVPDGIRMPLRALCTNYAHIFSEHEQLSEENMRLREENRQMAHEKSILLDRISVLTNERNSMDAMGTILYNFYTCMCDAQQKVLAQSVEQCPDTQIDTFLKRVQDIPNVYAEEDVITAHSDNYGNRITLAWKPKHKGADTETGRALHARITKHMLKYPDVCDKAGTYKTPPPVQTCSAQGVMLERAARAARFGIIKTHVVDHYPRYAYACKTDPRNAKK